MVKRMIVGAGRGTSLGVFISKPGKDVATCSDQDLLFDSDRGLLGVVAEQRVNFRQWDGWTTYAGGVTYLYTWTNIAVPNQGFWPLVSIYLETWPFLEYQSRCHIQYVSNTLIRAGIIQHYQGATPPPNPLVTTEAAEVANVVVWNRPIPSQLLAYV